MQHRTDPERCVDDERFWKDASRRSRDVDGAADSRDEHAGLLGLSAGALSRELARNSVDGAYVSMNAHRAFQVRRSRSKTVVKLELDCPLPSLVLKLLASLLSLRQIAKTQPRCDL